MCIKARYHSGSRTFSSKKKKRLHKRAKWFHINAPCSWLEAVCSNQGPRCSALLAFYDCVSHRASNFHVWCSPKGTFLSALLSAPVKCGDCPTGEMENMFYIWWTLARRPQTDSVSGIVFFRRAGHPVLHRWTRSVAQRRLIPLSFDKSSIHSRHSRLLVGRIQGQLLENGWYTGDQLYSCEQSWETKNSRSQLHDADIRFYSHSKAQESLCNIFILARVAERRQAEECSDTGPKPLWQSTKLHTQMHLQSEIHMSQFTCTNPHKSPKKHTLHSKRRQLPHQHGHQCQSDIWFILHTDLLWNLLFVFCLL